MKASIARRKADFQDSVAGFTLIELLVAVSILVIIAGAAYTAFQVALSIYRRSESRIVMNQKCRIALDRIATDLSNLQAVQGDSDLALVSQDNPDEASGDRDVISFVTLLQSDPDAFLAQLNPDGQTSLTDEEVQTPLLSDVQRVVYYIGEDPNVQEQDSEARGRLATVEDEDETQNFVLLRIATTSLNPETVILPLLESGSIPPEDDEGNPVQVNIATIIDGIVSFDLKYSDGEEWYESWEDTENLPKSVQVLITVTTEDARVRQARPDTVTQSTMVYLMMSANFTEQQAGTGNAQPGGG